MSDSGITRLSGLSPAERAAAVQHAGGALREGRVVVVPTDTVYSVAVAAGSALAPGVAAMFAEGPGSPAAWCPASLEAAAGALGVAAPVHRRLLSRLLPGPAIVVVSATPGALARAGEMAGVSAGALETRGAGGKTSEVALRRPRESAARDLIDAPGAPAVLLVEVPVRGGWAVEAEEAAGAVRGALGEERGRGMVVLDEGRAKPGRPATILHLAPGGGWEIRRPGAYEERFVRKQLHRTILFICTGNTCRSPMAEAIASDLVAKSAEGSLPTTVVSAGTGAIGGEPPSPEAVVALRAMGINPELRGSRTLTRQMIAEADAIYAMSRSHLRAVLAFDPTAAAKAQLLDPEGRDVPDPIGGPQEVYTETASRIADLVAARLRELDA